MGFLLYPLSSELKSLGYDACVKTLSLDDDHLVLEFPYDKGEVAEVKAIKGAKWDKVARVWRAPMSSINEVREFADANGFEIEPEVLLFTLPSQKNETRGIRCDEKWLFLHFSYDRVMIQSVKQIAGITWDKKNDGLASPDYQHR